MMRLQNISALFIKQVKDVIKNMPVLILFIVYPCIAAVMTQAMQGQAGSNVFFIGIFATMHCVFTPIVAASSILAEEKETNTLRVLIMSNVQLKEYFFSIGGFILLADILTGSTFLFIADYDAAIAVMFIFSLGIGCIISTVLGICIGLYAGNMAAATGLAVPFGMLFAFLPMLAYFNDKIERISKFTYGQQVSYLLSGSKFSLSGIIIICINSAVFITLAAVLYRRSLSED